MVLPLPWTSPNLTAVDHYNMGVVPVLSTVAQMNFDTTFKQVLFEDSRLELLFEEQAYSEYGKGLMYHFDSYCIYQKIKWPRPTDFTTITRGMFTEIPYRGYGGWVCSIYNCVDCSQIITTTTTTDDDGVETQTDTTTYESYYAYECLSRFITLEDLNFVFSDTMPDLTLSTTDDNSKYQYQGDNGVWQCNVTSAVVQSDTEDDVTWDTAVCTAELPRENGKDYVPLFRFVKEDSYHQLGYIINDDDISWTEFGTNVFSEASYRF